MLDRTQPFEGVYGLSGIAWTQEGRFFNFIGQEVAYSRVTDEDGERVVVHLVDHVEPEPVPPPRHDTSDLESMHWKQLKAFVEIYGGTYTDKPSAIEFLRNHE